MRTVLALEPSNRAGQVEESRTTATGKEEGRSRKVGSGLRRSPGRERSKKTAAATSTTTVALVPEKEQNRTTAKAVVALSTPAVEPVRRRRNRRAESWSTMGERQGLQAQGPSRIPATGRTPRRTGGLVQGREPPGLHSPAEPEERRMKPAAIPVKRRMRPAGMPAECRRSPETVGKSRSNRTIEVPTVENRTNPEMEPARSTRMMTMTEEVLKLNRKIAVPIAETRTNLEREQVPSKTKRKRKRTSVVPKLSRTPEVLTAGIRTSPEKGWGPSKTKKKRTTVAASRRRTAELPEANRRNPGKPGQQSRKTEEPPGESRRSPGKPGQQSRKTEGPPGEYRRSPGRKPSRTVPLLWAPARCTRKERMGRRRRRRRRRGRWPCTRRPL